MKKWLWMAWPLVAAAALAVGLRSRGSGAEVSMPPRVLKPMITDLRLSLLGPRSGARTEVRVLRVEGRVEGTGASSARVELGFLEGGEYRASKTITVPVGRDFSDAVNLPGDGPFIFYAGIVRLFSVARAEDIAVRPMAGRDLGRGSRLVLVIHLFDDRGRRMDGRVTVYQGTSIIGETHTAGGQAGIYDLPSGEYLVQATALNDWRASDTLRLRFDGSPQHFNLGPRPPE